MQKLGMFCGVVISLIGLSIMFTPFRVYVLLGWLVGFIMLSHGFSTLFSGINTKSRWRCVTGGVTMVIGGILVVSDMFEVLTQNIIIYLVAGGIIISGLIECFVGYSLLKEKEKRKNGVICFGMGSLSLAVGFFGLFYKNATVLVIGAIVGFHIVKMGVNLFVYARDYYKPKVIDLNESMEKS